MNENKDKMVRLLELLDNGVQPIIRWVKNDYYSIEECDAYSVSMLCKVTRYSTLPPIFDGDILYRVYTDFSEFESYNIAISNQFYTGEYPQWHETSTYPEDKKYTVYMQVSGEESPDESSGCMFEFVETESLTTFDEYKKSNSSESYISWLEGMTIQHLNLVRGLIDVITSEI
jgi:hypothetical protein